MRQSYGVAVDPLPIQRKDILSYLARRYATDDGQLPVVSKLWVFVLILTILFASLHQT